MDAEGFAVYYFLHAEGVEKAEEVARKSESAFKEFPHWLTSSHQEQEIRKSLYKAMIDAGVEGVVEAAQNVLKMLRRAKS